MGKNSLTVGILGQASAGILLEAMTLEGWTQREASERTGITRTRLMSILNAEKPATIDEIDMIAVALGRKASDVVAEAEQNLRPLSYDEITQAKLAQALQSDYAPAAKKHEESE